MTADEDKHIARAAAAFDDPDVRREATSPRAVDPLCEALTRDLNILRAAASRGPVSSREIFQMTDPMMDRLSRAALADAPQAAPASIARALWVEYLRVDEWASISVSEAHAARTAIRCCATRLGVYPEFVALDKGDGYLPPQPAPVDRVALVEALRAQRQADADGTLVTVSRQAVDEAISLIAAGLGRPGAVQPAETLAWAVVGRDGALQAWTCDDDKSACEEVTRKGERVVRVAIRIVDAEPAHPAPEARRCAECDCEGGGLDCTWFRSGATAPEKRGG